MGPTGVGKTEIARRLAKLMGVPFVKVEATKFTEVGYVGRDVDSMVRDLVESSFRLTKQKMLEEKYSIADEVVEDKLVAALVPIKSKADNYQKQPTPFDFIRSSGGFKSQKEEYEAKQAEAEQIEFEKSGKMEEIELTREQVRQQLRDKKLKEEYIEVEVTAQPKSEQLDVGNEGMNIAIGNIFDGLVPPKKKKKRVKVKEARKIIREEEASKLIDMDQVAQLPDRKSVV